MQNISTPPAQTAAKVDAAISATDASVLSPNISVAKALEQAAVQAKNGAAMAAMLAAGVGGVFFGIFITLAEHVPAFKAMMNLYNPVGPLSGKSTFGVLAWLISWGILHYVLRDREMKPRTALIVTFVLVGISLLLTFPPVYMALGG
jgi:uncharacterized membrane protein